jgi:hypothetical protein
MATFYLLPPRSILADHLGGWLEALLPGVHLEGAVRHYFWANLSEALAEEAVLVVHREDLPVGENAEQALIDGYGAEAGDEVVEVRPAGLRRDVGFVEGWTARRWRIGAGPHPSKAA